MMIELVLPWPPSVNHYKKVGRIITTRTGKKYQQRINNSETTGYYYQVYMIAKRYLPQEGVKFNDSATISLEVHAYLYPPNKRRYDLDNRLKVLLDSLVHAQIIKDDSQITRLYVEKMDTINQGKVVVKIQEII